LYLRFEYFISWHGETLCDDGGDGELCDGSGDAGHKKMRLRFEGQHWLLVRIAELLLEIAEPPKPVRAPTLALLEKVCASLQNPPIK
jgi:hypothetical protein